MLFYILSPNHFSYIQPSVRTNYYISPYHIVIYLVSSARTNLRWIVSILLLMSSSAGETNQRLTWKAASGVSIFTKRQTQWKFLQKSWDAVLDIAPYLAAKHKERHNERRTYKPIKIGIFNSVLSVGLARTSLQPPGSQCSLSTFLPVTSCFRYLTIDDGDDDGEKVLYIAVICCSSLYNSFRQFSFPSWC